MTHALDVPVLETGAGFRLRPWRLDDADLALVREASGDPLIPLITTVPARYTEEEGEAFVRRQWDRAARRTGYPLVIERAHDGRPVGNVGLWLFAGDPDRASLGYWVVPSARGQGAAGAALGALTRWALTTSGFARLELYVEPWNTASLRTAERAGFTREGLLRSWQRVGAVRRDMYMYARLGPGGRGL
ncbi:GNAT family N-acetyltransferase [Streptomyces abyssomicinicus]|uniref:GNAT family N-acetyltransferase n=1 Tax=Streptomyces abyssomicinicus TaxID=574929 RepID=UPI001250B398|nr:GNAT family protein [Streptomyces abyssomicinicus]